jgi:hypothetical protein
MTQLIAMAQLHQLLNKPASLSYSPCTKYIVVKYWTMCNYVLITLNVARDGATERGRSKVREIVIVLATLVMVWREQLLFLASSFGPSGHGIRRVAAVDVGKRMADQA